MDLKRLEDAFYWVATSKPFAKMANRAAAEILADPDTAACFTKYNALIERSGDDLPLEIEKFRADSIRARNEGGQYVRTINIPVPYEAFDQDSSPYLNAAGGLKKLLDACQQENVSLSASRKHNGTGFYLILDPLSPFTGLVWKRPAFGMRLDI